mgnify:CR=1 FL=1
MVDDLDFIKGLTTTQLNDVVQAANKFFDKETPIRIAAITFEDYLIDADYWVRDMIRAAQGLRY